MNNRFRLTTRLIIQAMFVISVVILIALWVYSLSLGIAVHDTIYMANPELGPDGWLKYTEQILAYFDVVILTLFFLLLFWMIASSAIVILCTKKPKGSNKAKDDTGD